MRILMPTSSYPLRSHKNWAAFVKETALAIAEQGHEVFILVFSPDNERMQYCEDRNPRVHVLAYGYFCLGRGMLHCSVGLIPSLRKSFRARVQFPFYLLASAFEILKAVRRYRIDLIHAMWYLPMGFIASLLKPLHRKPVVITGLGADLHVPNNVLMRWVLQFTARQADSNIVCSGYLRDRASQYGMAPARLDVIPNGIRTEHFAAHRVRSPESMVRIGCAKRLIPEKNLEDFVLAVGTLPRELKDRVQVKIAGEGPSLAKLETIVLRKGLGKQIRFMGAIPHHRMPEFLRGVDIYVDTSTQEGLATSNLEAVASGCILVAPDGYGNRDILQRGVRGYLYPARDVEALSALLARLIRKESDQEEVLLKDTAQIRKTFDVRQIAAQLIGVYSKNLSTERAPAAVKKLFLPDRCSNSTNNSPPIQDGKVKGKGVPGAGLFFS